MVSRVDTHALHYVCRVHIVLINRIIEINRYNKDENFIQILHLNNGGNINNPALDRSTF